MPFVDFDKLGSRHQEQIRKTRPKWSEHDLNRFAFWVRPNGEMSWRLGHHRLTEREGLDLDTRLKKEALGLTRDSGFRPEKGDLRGFTTGGKFTNSKG